MQSNRGWIVTRALFKDKMKIQSHHQKNNRKWWNYSMSNSKFFFGFSQNRLLLSQIRPFPFVQWSSTYKISNLLYPIYIYVTSNYSNYLKISINHAIRMEMFDKNRWLTKYADNRFKSRHTTIVERWYQSPRRAMRQTKIIEWM